MYRSAGGRVIVKIFDELAHDLLARAVHHHGHAFVDADDAPLPIDDRGGAAEFFYEIKNWKQFRRNSHKPQSGLAVYLICNRIGN